MTKIEKCLAKLYFALGEENSKSGKNAENSVSMVEYMSFLALRNCPEQVKIRFFLMGAASALRNASKPSRGKSSGKLHRCSSQPPMGKKSITKQKILKPSNKNSCKNSLDEYMDYMENGGFA